MRLTLRIHETLELIQNVSVSASWRKLGSAAGVSYSVAYQLRALTTQVNSGLSKFFWER